MLKQEHHPWTVRRFFRGSNADVDAEGLPDGFARDMQNMRSTSVDGNTGAAEKIKGEAEVSGDEGAPLNYYCIGACAANHHRVAFWASPVPGEMPIIRIDGVTMAASPLIPYAYDRPLQIAVRDIEGGFVYPADHYTQSDGTVLGSVPLVWDIQDIIDNYTSFPPTNKYFTNFNIEEHTVGLNAPPQFPKFIGLDDVGGGGGLPPGQYAYALRWVTAMGDRTNTGVETPLISVPYNVDLNGNPTAVYPGGRSYGGPPNLLNPTNYAIHLEFRIDNLMGFDSVEVIRLRYNDGAGITGAGVREVVGRIAITPGQFSIQQFVDPGDSNVLEVIPDDEAPIAQLDIDKPKGVEVMDNRVIYADFEVGSREFTPEFTEVGGNKVVAITRKLTSHVGGSLVPDGYNNPVRLCYDKSFARGEKYGLALQCWDGLLGKAPAIPIEGYQDWQLPNRRDEKAGDSLTYSDDPCWAANVDHVVTPTFEAFTQGTRAKTDNRSTANISPKSHRPVGTLEDQWDGLTSAPATNTTSAVGLSSGILSRLDIGYAPLNPTGNNGSMVAPNWDFIVNPRVADGTALLPYAPNGFAPTHQSLGGLLYGITNLPSWVKVFSVARTEPAGRVVAQGLWTWALRPNEVDGLPAKKSTAGGQFHCPDIANAVVGPDVIADMIANPGNYRLQFVAPLGFFTESFAHHSVLLEGVNMDLISYARVLHDQGEINPFDSGGTVMGANTPGAPYANNVDWGRWRSAATTGGAGGTSYWHQAGQNGNSLLNIDTVSEATNGRSQYLNVTTGQYCYREDATTSTVATSDAVRRYHEPWYIVNIIRTGVSAPSDNITKYVNTGASIMVKSAIGIATGTGIESFRLINERTFDAIPFTGTEYRYTYVNGKAWVCRTGNTFLTGPGLTTVLTDIAGGGWTSPDGTIVHGVYEYSSLTNSLIYGIYGALPVGARVEVRYDPTAPIRFFGGDRVISPAMCALHDGVGESSVLPTASSGFQLGGLPLPFSGYSINPRYMLMGDANSGQMEQVVVTMLRSLRQWVAMFDCETKTPLPLATNLLSTSATTAEDRNQFFPAVHYIMRPYQVYVSGSADDNGIYPQYESDYPHEISSGAILYGGFRFFQNVNGDYIHQQALDFASVPDVGFQEKTHYRTGVAWSAKADPTTVDDPGLRTFTTNALYVCDESTGEIKTIYSLTGGGQQNLYGRTHSGTFRLLTNKNVLTGAAGETVATQASDVFIGANAETWLSRTIGSQDEYWILGAKGTALVGSQYADTAFFCDRSTAYRQIGDSIVDIGTGKYNAKLLPSLVGGVGNGIYFPGCTGFFDPTHQEWWMVAQRLISVPNVPPPGSSLQVQRRLFVYSCQTGEWMGEFTYDHDKFMAMDGGVFGFKHRKDYKLNEGYLINGTPLSSYVESVYAQPQGMQKEAVRFRENSDNSPTAIELYDERKTLMSRADAVTFGPHWIKFIDGWEQFISRNMGTYDFLRKNPQQRLFFKRTVHDANERFVLNDSQLQLKQIK